MIINDQFNNGNMFMWMHLLIHSNLLVELGDLSQYLNKTTFSGTNEKHKCLMLYRLP